MPYDYEAYYPEAVPYNVTVSRRGDLVSQDVAAHPYIKRRADVGACRLTVGDLHAAAEWGYWPELQHPKPLDKMSSHQRRSYLKMLFQIQEVQSRALFRYLRHAKMMRVQELFSMSGAGARKAMKQPGKELDPQVVQKEMLLPGTFQERLAYTMLARLLAKLDPKLGNYQVFKARTGVDMI